MTAEAVVQWCIARETEGQQLRLSDFYDSFRKGIKT